MGVLRSSVARRPSEGVVRADVHGQALEWRIRPISSLDVCDAGGSGLYAILARSAEEGRVLAADPASIRAGLEMQRAVVCAGVTGCRAVGTEEWDSSERLVLHPPRPARAEVIWVGELPDATIAKIAKAVRALSGEAAEGGTFRAAGSGDAGSGGAALRHGPLDGGEVASAAPGAGPGGDVGGAGAGAGDGG